MRGLIFGFLFAMMVTPFTASAQEANFGPHPMEDFGKSGGIYEQLYKFSVILDASGRPTRLVYQNINTLEFHRDLLINQPEFKGMTPVQIDEVTYKANPARRALIGVVRDRTGDDGISWTHFNLLMDETPRAEDIIAVQKLLSKSLSDDSVQWKGDKIEFEPAKSQVAGMKAIADTLAKAKVFISEPPKEESIRPYTNAWKVGRLEWVSSQDELNTKIASGAINSKTIIVTDQVLREFPPVAGIISANPLTPVSHAVLLAQMYEAPVMYHEHAATIFKSLSGHNLFLQTSTGETGRSWDQTAEYIVDPPAETIQRLMALQTKPKLDVQLDLSQTIVRSVKELNLATISAYGGKSSQMGLILNTIPQNAVSEAAGIPIAAFKQFMKMAKASNGQVLEDFVLQSLAKIPQGQESSNEAAAILKMVRAEVKNAAVPKEVLDPIRTSLEKMFPGDSVRLKLRSSSNVEDGAEFNGAGLYDSKGAWLKGGPADDLAKTLKQVWSSLYTDRGFAARRRFQVDETKAGMGILAHVPFKNEQANGVISLNLDAKKSNRFAQIVTQPGEEALVTHSGGEILAEIVKIDRGYFSVEQTYEGKSNIKTLLRQKQYEQIEQLMQQLAKNYQNKDGKVNIEAEWKLANDKIYIKQVRRIPQPHVATLADSSRLILTTGRDLVFRTNSGGTSDAFNELWGPRDVHIKMPSVTEVEMKAGKITVEEVNFMIEGNRYTVKNPKATYRESNDRGYFNRELVIETPAAANSSLRMIIKLPEPGATGPFVPNAIHFEADENKTTAKLGQMDAFEASLEILRYGEVPDDYDNDRVEGKDVFKLSITGKHPVTIINEKVKRKGEGDGSQLKIGQATIYGILDRALVIPHIATGYGASHHDGFESFVFDLMADPKLTDAEKKTLTDKGRYLYLATRDWGGAGDDGEARLVKVSGDFEVLGKWKESAGINLPKTIPVMFKATTNKAADPKACNAIFK